MIIPAILEKTVDGFNEKLSLIKKIPKLERIQIDFCDGEFVEKESLSIEKIIEKVGKLDRKYHWEAHLMIKFPGNFEIYEQAGFSQLILHYEAFPLESELEDALGRISKLGMTPAIAINPETTVSVVRYLADTISNFTIMSVHPGKQGQSFLDSSIGRVELLREIASNATIEVDGGVNAYNAEALINAGANHLAVGSALFETENIKQNYNRIAEAIR